MDTHWRRICGLALGALAIAASAGVGASSALAKPAASSTCPSSNAIGNFKEASNVGAKAANSGNVTTYTFESLQNESPVGGVPGLIKYCIYPMPAAAPTAITTDAKGANGAAWSSLQSSGNFAFVRPGGDKTNIPLDGKTTTIGTATWSTLPTEQIILLHINDPNTCAALYPAGAYEPAPSTCFVKPSKGPTGPVCDTGNGNTLAAYNSIPTDVLKGCLPPSGYAYEGNFSSAWGDLVELEGSGTELASLRVIMASFGCGDKGHWFTKETNAAKQEHLCVTETNKSFTVPMTAKLYEEGAGEEPGSKIGEAKVTATIPFRPSANTEKCTEANAGKWYDEVAKLCRNSIAEEVTFTFPTGITVPANKRVIWTVEFNTTHAGYEPIGENTPCFEAVKANAEEPGCGYDSLNLGARTYEGAPYAGKDVNPIGIYWAPREPPSLTTQLPLQLVEGEEEFKLLGEIRLK